MDIKEIEAFFDKFEKSSIAEMELEADNVRLVLKKESCFAKQAPAMPPFEMMHSMQMPAQTVSQQVEDKDILPEETGTVVKAPIVGTFYRAPSPGSEPFVKVGQMVKKDDPICMVEAMKIMNEILAPCDGEVINIKPEDGDFVAYDETLIVIKEK